MLWVFPSLKNLSLIFLQSHHELAFWSEGPFCHKAVIQLSPGDPGPLLDNGQVATHDSPSCGRLIQPLNSTTFASHSVQRPGNLFSPQNIRWISQSFFLSFPFVAADTPLTYSQRTANKSVEWQSGRNERLITGLCIKQLIFQNAWAQLHRELFQK